VLYQAEAGDELTAQDVALEHQVDHRAEEHGDEQLEEDVAERIEERLANRVDPAHRDLDAAAQRGRQEDEANAAPQPSSRAISSGSTGLTKWWSMPASRDRRRSSGWP
jgi:hypothetical protein